MSLLSIIIKLQLWMKAKSQRVSQRKLKILAEILKIKITTHTYKLHHHDH